jgi:hypothetical protein
VSPPDINENDRERKRSTITTTIEIVVAPLAAAFPDPMVPVKTVMVVPDIDMVVPDSRARVATRFAAPPSTPPPVLETTPEPADGPVEGGATTDNIPEPSTATPKTKLRRLDKMATDASVSDQQSRSTFAAWRRLTERAP